MANKILIAAYFFNDIQGTESAGVIFAAGNGDGTFAAPVQIPLLANPPSQMVAVDLNADKKLDLVIQEEGDVISYLGNSDGTFTPLSQIVQGCLNSILVADVTGDGVPDLVCPGETALQVYSGTGDGTFTTSPTSTTPFPSGLPSLVPSTLQTGYLSGDSRLDVSIATQGVGELVVFLNDGSGSFTVDPNFYYTGPVNIGGLSLTRLNRNAGTVGQDHNLDALVDGAGLISLLNLNNAAPTAAPPSLTLSTANGQTTVTAGETVTVNASLTVGAGKTAPSGSITFYVNQVQVSTSELVQANASAQIPIQGTGAITVSAVYSGDANYPGVTAFLTLTSSLSPTTTTLTSSSTAAPQGTNITFTATVSPSTATGTVTFSDGTTTLGTGVLNAGVATFSTNSLAPGTHSIKAAYGGDANDAASTSSAVSVTIAAATLQISANPSTLNIAQGSSGSTVITVTPVGAYSGTVTFQCSGLPANSTCTFSPASLIFTASETAQTTTLKIATNVTAQAMLQPQNSGLGMRKTSRALYASIFLLPTAILFCLRRRWNRALIAVLLLLVSGAVLSLSACGGGSNGNSMPTGPVTPVGTSTVIISSGASGPSLTLTVNISQ